MKGLLGFVLIILWGLVDVRAESYLDIGKSSLSSSAKSTGLSPFGDVKKGLEGKSSTFLDNVKVPTVDDLDENSFLKEIDLAPIVDSFLEKIDPSNSRDLELLKLCEEFLKVSHISEQQELFGNYTVSAEIFDVDGTKEAMKGLLYHIDYKVKIAFEAVKVTAVTKDPIVKLCTADLWMKPVHNFIPEFSPGDLPHCKEVDETEAI